MTPAYTTYEWDERLKLVFVLREMKAIGLRRRPPIIMLKRHPPPGVFLGLCCLVLLGVIFLEEYGSHSILAPVAFYVKVSPRVGAGQHRSA